MKDSEKLARCEKCKFYSHEYHGDYHSFWEEPVCLRYPEGKEEKSLIWINYCPYYKWEEKYET